MGTENSYEMQIWTTKKVDGGIIILYAAKWQVKEGEGMKCRVVIPGHGVNEK